MLWEYFFKALKLQWRCQTALSKPSSTATSPNGAHKRGQMSKPAVLSAVSAYAASYVPKAVMLDLPESLADLYDKQARDCNPAE